MAWALRAVLAAAAVVAATSAQAFCGFYVARADGALTNRSSKVVYTRVNETSTITMSSDYQGPVAEFAMIVPTPMVLERRQVRTVPVSVVNHLDSYSAPRLVEYFDDDPCNPPLAEPVVVAEARVGSGSQRAAAPRSGAKALGVKILAEYAVGNYDIQILSAKESDGLITYLRQEGYRLPAGAEGAVSGYVKGGMKFFVARVNLGRHAASSTQELEPLQLTFKSKDFMLPLQLGKVNGDGVQDLLVMTLTRQGRVRLANYPMKELPTDVDVPVFVKSFFPQFYKALFERTAGRAGAVLEYAWDMGWCDPCADDPLTLDEFRKLGVVWVNKGNLAQPNVYVTRMRIRYGRDSFREDLMFTETAERGNFQGRYVIRHPFDGAMSCPAAKDYIADTRARLRREGDELRRLTGWSADLVRTNIARSTPAAYR